MSTADLVDSRHMKTEPKGNAASRGDGGQDIDLAYEPPVPRMSSLRFARRYGVYFVFATIAFGAMSFLVLLGLTPLEPTPPVILATIAINALFVAVLCALVGREVWNLIKARKRGRAAARMHIRIVGLFGVVAALPAIVVAIIAGITLDLGLARIFEARTKTIVDSSISVARSYVREATGTLQGNTVNMAFFLGRNQQLFNLDRQGFSNLMTGQARALGLIGAQVVDRNGQVIVKANVPVRGNLPDAPPDFLRSVDDGKPSCILPRTRNISACAMPLKELDEEYYLFTMRLVDPSVLNSLQLMEEITAEYEVLEQGRIPLQIAFALLYFGICLTILLAAIWMGIAVADRLVAPIRQLISAADAVKAGRLDVQVPTIRTEGELRSLSDTFNAMTANLKAQRDEILDNQELIDRRRRFTEAVLSGVSAGVVGISPEGRVAISNTTAQEILGRSDEAMIGESLADVAPELKDVVENARGTGRVQHLEQITLFREGRERILNVQVTLEGSAEHAHSNVITLDDITDLVAAQRTSAWADVARRIAHEIKNPLTPIQLSAERIRRRYGKRITEDREVFDQCTDTIIRQVADIGRMVDEFSSFARMPKPTMQKGNLAEPLREAAFLHRVGDDGISVEMDLPDQPAMATFDGRLLGQAFSNLIKNAKEAMEDVIFAEGEGPRVQVVLQTGEKQHCIEFIDNGKGLPKENRQRLLEPYMTTREKGTGLGLAIVGKILEEHGGTIELMDAPEVASGGRGAMVRVCLPAQPDSAVPDTKNAADETNDNAGKAGSDHGL